MESLGQKIRKLRLGKKMTQRQLANGVVSASAISQIESDKITPTYKLMFHIAERLEVPLDSFLSDHSQLPETSTAHTLAKAFIEGKEYEKALSILEQYVTAQDAPSRDLLKDLATCYLHLKNYRQANHHLEILLKDALTDEDHDMYLWALNTLGSLFYHQNKLALALHYWQKAYEYLQHTESLDAFLKTRIFTNFATVNYKLGNYDLSVQLFQQSQELLETSSNMQAIAANYIGLGVSLHDKSEHRLAEAYFREAITIYKSLNQIQYVIFAKENFGIIRGENGEYEDALKTLEECLQEYREYGFLPQMANSHGEIAKLLIAMSRFEEACVHLEQAFQKSEPDSPNHAQCFYVRSLLHRAQNRYQEAISDAVQAKNLYSQTESIREYNKVCLYLSDIYKTLEDYKSSTEIMEESQAFVQAYLKEKGVIV